MGSQFLPFHSLWKKHSAAISSTNNTTFMTSRQFCNLQNKERKILESSTHWKEQEHQHEMIWSFKRITINEIPIIWISQNMKIKILCPSSHTKHHQRQIVRTNKIVVRTRLKITFILQNKKRNILYTLLHWKENSRLFVI